MTKKELLIITAKELFWKHGFKKVSVDEICKKSNISRKTFYTYYNNKNSLVISILKELTDEMFDSFEQLVNNDSKNFSEKLTAMLELKYDANKNFSMEFVSDFYHPDSSEILDFFKVVTGKSISLTGAFFEQAQQTGEMNPDLDINFVMWYYQKQIELLQSVEFQTLFSDSLTMSKQLSELLIYGIMPVKK